MRACQIIEKPRVASRRLVLAHPQTRRARSQDALVRLYPFKIGIRNDAHGVKMVSPPLPRQPFAGKTTIHHSTRRRNPRSNLVGRGRWLVSVTAPKPSVKNLPDNGSDKYRSGWDRASTASDRLHPFLFDDDVGGGVNESRLRRSRSCSEVFRKLTREL
jgi:hypothetical protein